MNQCNQQTSTKQLTPAWDCTNLFVHEITLLQAIQQGMGDLTRNAIVGTILAMLLLLPGLAMVFGGLKYPSQSFNRFSSGVFSVLLLVSVRGLAL